MFWIPLILVIAITIAYKINKCQSYWKDNGVPYVLSWPLFGETVDIIFRRRSIPESTQNRYNKIGNGRYLGMYQFFLPILLLKDPDLIKKLTVKDFDHFMNHRDIISADIDPLFGRNLLTLKGQEWRIMRNTLSPAFTSSKMRSMLGLVTECANQFTDYFLKNDIEVSSVEMKDIFSRYTADVIATIAFGLKCDSVLDKSNEFYVMGKTAADFGGLQLLKFLGFTVSPALMKFFDIKLFSTKVSNFFRDIINRTIEIRERDHIIRPDMLHLLMEAKKGKLKHDEDEDALNEDFTSNRGTQTVKQFKIVSDWSDDDLVAQALVFFLGGFDTVSTLMCYTAYELALNPDVQEKLQKDIDERLKASDGKIIYEQLLKMKYLDMVISEALRKWPPLATTDRACVKDYIIEPENKEEGIVPLKKGVVIAIPIYALHRDPENFPNPEKFDPERFNDINKSNIKPFTYLPFGIGPRNCIGSRFALLEVKALIVALVSKFDIVVTEKTQIPIKLSKAHFNMTPEKGFWLGLKSRKI